MVTTIDAANGDTAYPLDAAKTFMLGHKADGRSLWVANVDATGAVVSVEWSGAVAGIGKVNLTAKGDHVTIPAGDITVVTVTASTYPATIGWAYLDPLFAIGSGDDGQSVTIANTPLPVSQPGLSGGILQTVTTVGAAAALVPATPLAGRATMLVQNVGATTIYLGESTVTADTAATGGLQLLPGQSIPIALAAAVLLYAISSAAGGLVMTLEAAA